MFIKVIQQRNAFLMWFVMWFFIFFWKAETVHDNHQCSYWENLVHIYAIFQYSIILEMIICSSSVTLFVSWFHYLFVWSVCITVDEKHFCQICSSSNMSKNYTQNKNAHFMWFFMWYVYEICTFCTSANNKEMHFDVVMLSFVLFGSAKTMHYNHQCYQWQNLVHIYAVCQYQIIVEIIIWTSVHNMYVFQVGLWAITYMHTTQSCAICTECCT